MTKYAHLPALVDDNGVMVGYVDANHKERDLQGNLVPPGTTPTPGGGSVDWDDITGVPAELTAAQAAGTPSIRAIGTTATTAMAGNTTIPALSTSLPAALAANAAIGNATTSARANHVHAIPAASNGTLRGTVMAQPAIADAAAAPTMAEFNAVLAALRSAGVLLT